MNVLIQIHRDSFPLLKGKKIKRAIHDIQSNCQVFLHIFTVCGSLIQHSELYETALMITAHALSASKSL